MFVAIARDGGFEDGHTVEVAEEVGALDGSGVYAFFAEFAEEAAIAIVDGIGDTAEVADKIVGGTSVDVVDRHTGWDLFAAPSHIDRMRGKDAFRQTESILELQILSIAMRVGFPALYRSCVRQHFPSVGIDTHTEDASASAVDIEGDARLGAGGDIAHLHVIKEEGRAYLFRLADEIKAALAHNNREFECLQGRQR